jgi:glycosyltransferase involved in cell wall biosynthesis
MIETSIIIRTKNEERWINSCFSSIFSQSYKEFEIIVVDNNSTDKTIEKIKNFEVSKIIKIKNYLPGYALNEGIKKSSGKFIVVLSAHCIPTNKKWLINLVNSIKEDEKYAGVYGRQQPMSFSSNSDKRDLTIVFGLDRKIQVYDNFFHNANSIIRKSCWDVVNFDKNATNIEDRIWAQEMIKRKFKILYEPKASVYHYHGIHQEGNKERLSNVVNIIEKIDTKYETGKINPKKLEICAIIPVRGNSINIGKKKLIDYTLEVLKKSKFINKVVLSTDSKRLGAYSKNKGVSQVIYRPGELSENHINLEVVQKFTLKELENKGYYPDLVLHVEETYPFRHKDDIDSIILKLVSNNFDSVILTKSENNWIWAEKKGKYERIDEGDVPRIYQSKTFIGLHGLGLLTRPEFIRNGNMLGNKIGLFNSGHPLANLEIRTKDSLSILKKIL